MNTTAVKSCDGAYSTALKLQTRLLMRMPAALGNYSTSAGKICCRLANAAKDSLAIGRSAAQQGKWHRYRTNKTQLPAVALHLIRSVTDTAVWFRYYRRTYSFAGGSTLTLVIVF